MKKSILIISLIFSIFNLNALDIKFSNNFEEILFEGKKRNIIENLNRQNIPNHFHSFIIKDAYFVKYYLQNYNNFEKMNLIAEDVWLNTLCSIINIGDESLSLLNYNVEVITDNTESNLKKIEKAYEVLESINVERPSEEAVLNACLIFNEDDLNYFNIKIEDLK